MKRSHVPVSVISLLALLGACSSEPLAVRSGGSQTLSVAIGQELDLKVQTVGPGEYQSPPSISSPALRFLNVTLVGPYLPAGPTQLFRFKADAAGRVIVILLHSGNDPTITDTVIIR